MTWLRLALATLAALLAEADEDALRQATLANASSASPMALWLALATAKSEESKDEMSI